jgi:hypothetical protein
VTDSSRVVCTRVCPFVPFCGVGAWLPPVPFAALRESSKVPYRLVHADAHESGTLERTGHPARQPGHRHTPDPKIGAGNPSDDRQRQPSDPVKHQDKALSTAGITLATGESYKPAAGAAPVSREMTAHRPDREIS